MTRRLILTRHAKSDWGHSGLADHDRPLNSRGRKSAAAIGRWLRAQGYSPRAAVLSTARRVRETWEGVHDALEGEVPATWERGLYLSTPEEMMNALPAQSADSVILIAHNPGMASLAQWLAEDPPQRDEFDRFPTGATLVMDFEADSWGEIRPLSGRVVDFVVPRDLTD